MWSGWKKRATTKISLTDYPFPLRPPTLRLMTSSGKPVAPADSSEEEAESLTQPTDSFRIDGESHCVVNVGSTELKEIDRRLFRHLLKKSGRQEAYDLYQDIWMDYLLAEKRGPVRTREGLRRQIARCVLAKFYERKRSDRERLTSLDDLDPQGEHHMRVEAVEIHLFGQNLNEALSKLPTTHREVLRCVVVEGKSWQETAAELGISVNTVKKYSSEARPMLRRLLEQALSRTTVPSGEKR